MEWYYTKDQKQHGPISQEALLQKISAGDVSSNDFAWRMGAGDWQPISTYSELQITSGSNTASPPPVGSNSPTPRQFAPPASKTSGLAIASLCLGIGSIVTCLLILGIPAIICGHMALGEIKRSKETIDGSSMAIVGLVTGYIATIGSALVILYIILVVAAVAI